MRPVLVLNLYYHGGVALVRTLGRMGVAVHAVHDDLTAPAAGSRYLRGLHELKLDGDSDERTLERVLELGRSLGGPPVLIVADDTAGSFVEAYSEALHEVFTFPRQPQGLTTTLFSKRGLHELCLAHDVPSPRSGFPQTRDDAREIIERSVFPLMIKPIDNVRFNRRNDTRMYIAQDATDALEAYDRFEDPADPNIMLQEYLPGTSADVWVFTGYFDEHSELVFGAGGRKLRQYPIHTGTTCYGILESNPEMEAVTARFVKALGYRGVWDCGYRLDPRDGRYKLLDVNPRVGQNFRQCIGRCGLDVVQAMYLDLTGQPVPDDVPDEGRIWWVENFDAAAAVGWVREGGLTARSWLNSLRRVDETAWFARDDLRPFRRVVAASANAAVRRVKRSRSDTRT